MRPQRRYARAYRQLQDRGKLFVADVQFGHSHRHPQPAVLRRAVVYLPGHRDCTFLGEADRAVDQAGDHATYPRRIAAQHRRSRIFDDQVQTLVDRSRAFQRTGGAHFLQQVERSVLQRQLARFDHGQIDNVFDQLQQIFHAVLRACRELLLRRGEPGIEQQFQHADHTIHRRADFMIHVGQQIAQRGKGGVTRLRFGNGCHICIVLRHNWHSL